MSHVTCHMRHAAHAWRHLFSLRWRDAHAMVPSMTSLTGLASRARRVAELVADNDRIAADNARLAEEQAKNRAEKAANDREIAQLMGAGASDDAETAPRPTNGVRTQRATEAGTPAPARRGKPKLRWKEA